MHILLIDSRSQGIKYPYTLSTVVQSYNPSNEENTNNEEFEPKISLF